MSGAGVCLRATGLLSGSEHRMGLSHASTGHGAHLAHTASQSPPISAVAPSGASCWLRKGLQGSFLHVKFRGRAPRFRSDGEAEMAHMMRMRRSTYCFDTWLMSRHGIKLAVLLQVACIARAPASEDRSLLHGGKIGAVNRAAAVLLCRAAPLLAGAPPHDRRQMRVARSTVLPPWLAVRPRAGTGLSCTVVPGRVAARGLGSI